MYNEVRTQQLTEAELRSVVRNMIIEEIENGQLDEGFLDNLRGGWNALRGTFGGDANRVQQAGSRAGQAVSGAVRGAGQAVQGAAQRAGQAVSGAVRNAGQAVQGAAQRAGQAVQGAAQGVKQYGQDRMKAFKGQYNASQNITKINNLMSTLDELQQSGVLSGPQMGQAIAAIKKQLQGAISRNKGAITGWQNSVS